VGTTYVVEAKPSDPALGFGLEAEPLDNLPLTVSQFAQAQWTLIAAHDAILEHCVDQTFHVNRKHRESEIYAVDDRLYLSMQNLTLPKGRARKQETGTAVHRTILHDQGPR
jgi:hypothetical protein